MLKGIRPMADISLIINDKVIKSQKGVSKREGKKIRKIIPKAEYELKK